MENNQTNFSNYFILNADDFGMSKAYNKAIKEGFECGILKSASLVANGDAFEEAIDYVIPSCTGLGIGIHLNIIEGKALNTELSTLTGNGGIFNNSYAQLLIKSLLPKNEVFMQEIEKEFRSQIEKIIEKVEVTHIDSHVHTHSIPKIFELTCKLAKEYGIKQIRTQFEKPYFVPELQKHLTIKYPINLIKVVLLNSLTILNRKTIKTYGLKTNDYLIGVAYTSMMNSKTLSYGLEAINGQNLIVESLIHPCRYEDGTVDNHFEEFQITKNSKLCERIKEMGFKITNYIENAEESILDFNE